MAPVESSPDAGVEGAAAPASLLRDWMAVGTAQRRIVQSLSDEVRHVSADVANEATHLVEMFRDLAARAKAQNERVSLLSSLADTIELDNANVSFEEMATFFEQSLADIVSKILLLSQNAMSMVYVFEEVKTSITEVERCVTEVDRINSQTRMLAINARIEASRAGDAGRAFGVISDEVRSLSSGTQRLSDTMRTHIGAVTRGLRNSHDALQKVATVDMSENLLAKDRLDTMMRALLQRSQRLGAITASAAVDADLITRQVGTAIMALQFQDRVSQKLAQIVDTLGEAGEAVGRVQGRTEEATGLPPELSSEIAAWLDQVASRYRLSEMRTSFLGHVREGGGIPGEDTADTSAGSVELF